VDTARSTPSALCSFATAQNKLHWAIHGQTAAEVIYHRADAGKEQMGPSTWKDAPTGKIQHYTS